jgi:hypothetical protein
MLSTASRFATRLSFHSSASTFQASRYVTATEEAETRKANWVEREHHEAFAKGTIAPFPLSVVGSTAVDILRAHLYLFTSIGTHGLLTFLFYYYVQNHGICHRRRRFRHYRPGGKHRYSYLYEMNDIN